MVQTSILLRRNRRDSAGKKRLALVALCCLWATVDAGASEPALTARLNTVSATLGDPLLLRLTVDRDTDARTLFPNLAGQLDPFVVHSAAAARVSDLGPGRQRDERVYELRAYTLEADQIPVITVPVVSASGDTTHLLSEALAVAVEPVRDPAEGDDLRDIKPPLWIAGGVPLWLAGILAALLAAGVAYLAWRFLRRSPVAALAAAPAPRGPVDYVREFARIADMGLLERGATKLYYTRLADVMRRFLEDRTRIDALERTTAEIAADLVATDDVDADSAASIIEFLKAADLVKFARAEPEAEIARRAPVDGADIVREVEARLVERQVEAQAATTTAETHPAITPAEAAA